MAIIKETCKECGNEFNLPRFKKQEVEGGFCCNETCCNSWWNRFYESKGEEVTYIICEHCNCKSARKYAKTFCSKGCYLTKRNLSKIVDGSHNFGHEYSKRSTAIQISKGLHPFQKGNMDEETLKRKFEGISRARKQEAKVGTHIWQRPETWINNEYSRSLSVITKRNLNLIHLYIADCDVEECFKIGWTSDITMREMDKRTRDLSNLVIVKSGNPIDIINLEKIIKLKFLNVDFSYKHKSTEIFPNSMRDAVVKYIQEFK